VKSSKLIMGCLATLALTTGIAVAQDEAAREAIAERLKPVGQLCLQGEDCGTTVAAASGGASSGGGDIDGAGIYNSVCMACHETGAAGAPVRGDEEAWSARVEQGFATLLDHSINGFNAMPAKGGNPNLSDAEVEAATAYLVEPVMEVPEAAAEEEAPAEDVAASDDAASDEDMAAGDEAATEEATEETAQMAEAGAGASGSDSGLDGEALYGSSGCAACHASGAAGAPIVGDADAWASRLEKGAEALYASAINGIGAMPPKGGNMGLSDEEVQAIVDHMVAEVE
jgi:cytochrome c5